MLIQTGEVILVLVAECLTTWQVRFVALHRLRLSPWACASGSLPSSGIARVFIRRCKRLGQSLVCIGGIGGVCGTGIGGVCGVGVGGVL